ncbi:MAG TPA: hypothetical protein VMV46_02385, partial [Thermoanaerobaculia bacterium]|nr:hypothetical protein [Thermoanaerobaculia bacterium]
MRRLDELLAAEPVRVVALRAAALAVEAHLVGGAVRDALLGRESHDFDLVVSARGRELAEGVAAETGARFVPLGGKEFASFRVVAARREGDEEPPWELDLWDREGGSLDADLARRDFTVNSIALALGPEAASGVPVDPFGGVADLERRLLRATTAASFSDDPLRVLRLPRFLVRFAGFEAEPATVELARRSVPGLASVARERVRDELMLLFAGDGAHRGVASMLGLGVYPSLWLGEPGAPVGGEEEQGAAGAVGAVGRLSARAEEVARLAAEAPPVDLPAARWALTFRPLAAPAATAVHQLEAFRDRGFLTREAAVRVARLVAESGVPVGERERRRLLHRLGAAWP